MLVGWLIKVEEWYRKVDDAVNDFYESIGVGAKAPALEKSLRQAGRDVEASIVESTNRMRDQLSHLAVPESVRQAAKSFAKLPEDWGGLIETAIKPSKNTGVDIGTTVGKNVREGYSTEIQQLARDTASQLRDVAAIISTKVTFKPSIEVFGKIADQLDQARQQVQNLALEFQLLPTADVARQLATARNELATMTENARGLAGPFTTAASSAEDIVRQLRSAADLWAEFTTRRAAFLGISPIPTPETVRTPGRVSPFTQALDDLGRVIHDRAAGIGNALADIVTRTRDFGTALGDVIRALSGDIGGVAGGLIGSIAGIGGTLVPVIGGFISGIIDFIGGLFGPSETAQRNQQIRDSINATLREMAVLGQEDITAPVREFARNLGVKLKDAGLSVTTATQAVIDNIDLVAKQFAQGATLQEAVNAVIKKLRKDLEEGEQGVSDAVEGLTSALRNLPTGFRVAGLRFGAQAPGGRLAGFEGQSAIAGLTVQGDIVIQTAPGEDGEVTLKKIENALERRRLRGGGGLRVSTGGNVPPVR